MTRVRISAGILCFLVCMSIFCGIFISKKCSGFIGKAELIWQEYSSGDHERAYRSAVELEQEWKSFRSRSAVLVDNEKLLEIERIGSRIACLVENDSEEIHSELMELTHMLNALKKSEIPTLSTVF